MSPLCWSESQMQSICSWLKVMLLLAVSPPEDDEFDLDDDEEEVVVEWRKSDRCGWES